VVGKPHDTVRRQLPLPKVSDLVVGYVGGRHSHYLRGRGRRRY
jgi:hypothetical protein